MGYQTPKNGNNYWKTEHLDNYRSLPIKEVRTLFEQRKGHISLHKTKDALISCLRRYDSGLISYAELTNEELRELCRKRGVEMDFGKNNKGRREEVIRLLDDADSDPKFENFTRLPPELRSRVYSHYFSSFSSLRAPKQPPLTLTSSLVRGEALPLFYSTCTFEVGFRYDGPSKVIMPDQTLLWLHSTDADNLADMKHIVLSLGTEVGRRINLAIDHTKVDKSFRFSLDFNGIKGRKAWDRWAHDRLNKSYFPCVEEEVAKVTKEVAKREKGWKLEKNDFFALRKALEEAERKARAKGIVA